MTSPLTLNRRTRRQRLVAALLVGTTAVTAAAAASPVASASTELRGGAVDVIVRQLPGAGDTPEDAVVRLGGTVGAPLPVIDGFSASVPSDALATLRGADGVAEVTPDGTLQLLSAREDQWKPDTDLGSLYTVNKGTGVESLWGQSDPTGRRKVTGYGVGVALIDSGVVAVEGLTTPGRVVNGPDLSFESQSDELRHLDTFGHGTHMAGVIVGRDTQVKEGNENDKKHFVGVAPDATLVNLKVASSDGAVDVSQVIAAVDWVVQHRNDPGVNIRVINLSFGTESTQGYLLDPLAYAVEVAWRSGIVVVVAAGNEGNLTDTLTNPATDPYVIAVGASDHRGTEDRKDDRVADFSSRGSLTRAPDLVAPGRSIVSLRNPMSHIDQEHPEGRVVDTDMSYADRFFRGSGTSQAAAYVSGVAALILQKFPDATPDQVKRLLTMTADPITGTDLRLQGAGLIDVKGISERSSLPKFGQQTWPLATGLGSLEAARGGSHVADPEDGTELVGEVDIMGEPWDGRTWSVAALEGRTWSGGDWNGRTWSGDDWSGSSWTGRTWSGRTWSGRTWSGRTWSGRTWSDNVWDGRTWSGRTWSGRTWSGRTWSGRTWSGVTWR